MNHPHHTNGAFENSAVFRRQAYSLLIGLVCARLLAAESGAPRAVSIYIENVPQTLGDLPMAKLITSQIFSDVGVRIDWIAPGNELLAAHDGAIIIRFSVQMPHELEPRALALAFPFEGTHIQVFYERVRQMVPPKLVPALLAHVFAHEIGHMLEATDVHSSTGIMKPRWDARDYNQMSPKRLSFTDFDKTLIYRGLDARAERLTADLNKHE